MVAKVSPYDSSQPESSPGRVCAGSRPRFRFLLGFAPDGGYLSRRVTATLVRSYIKPLRAAPFHHYSSQQPVVGIQQVALRHFYWILTTDY